MKGLTITIYLLSAGIFPWLMLGPFGALLGGPLRRILVFIVLAILGSYLVRGFFRNITLWSAFIFTTLFYSVVYNVASFLPDLSTYPFSLAWSESSRFYYASLFFAERIYRADVPTSVLHPSRYLMQSFPFIFGETPLWLHRLWQVVLWVVFSVLAAALLVWRINRAPGSGATRKGALNTSVRLALFLWAFLFLFQGPVYYHLLLMVVLLLWGFDEQRFWKTSLFVLIASLWAGISRVNWFPVPGMLASALYFLQVPVRSKPVWRYLWQPFVWTVAGGLAALLAQQLYILWSANPTEQFASSFSSDLLWYRLFPNPTYPLGILPSISLVSLPLLLAIVYRLYRQWDRYHFIRLLGLAAILFVLLAGGVIVSLKIGGGSNLHNLDAYLVLLLVVGAYIALGRFPEDENTQEFYPSLLASRLLTAFAVVLPVYFAINMGGPMPQRSMDAALAALDKIKGAIAQHAASGEDEVLFISQRHLLTFGEIQNVRLIPDYEKVFLMEMAMAGSEAYLNAFYEDVKEQRYALIVSDPLKIIYQGSAHSFGEENDAWVSNVSEPVLCYYEPLETFIEIDTQILVPRSQPCE